MNTKQIYESISDLCSTNSPWSIGRGHNKKHFSLKHEGLTDYMSDRYGKTLRIVVYRNFDSPQRIDLEIDPNCKPPEGAADELRRILEENDPPEWLVYSTGRTKIAHLPASSNELKTIQMIREFVEFLTPLSRTRHSTSAKIEKAIDRMVENAYLAELASGSTSTSINKDTRVEFANASEFKHFVRQLLREQSNKCAISQIEFTFDPDKDAEDFLVSLDRIDSQGDYSPDNLQLVCRFINFWKKATPDKHFRELICRVIDEGIRSQSETRCDTFRP